MRIFSPVYCFNMHPVLNDIIWNNNLKTKIPKGKARWLLMCNYIDDVNKLYMHNRNLFIEISTSQNHEVLFIIE